MERRWLGVPDPGWWGELRGGVGLLGGRGDQFSALGPDSDQENDRHQNGGRKDQREEDFDVHASIGIGRVGRFFMRDSHVECDAGGALAGYRVGLDRAGGVGLGVTSAPLGRRMRKTAMSRTMSASMTKKTKLLEVLGRWGGGCGDWGVEPMVGC